MMATSPKNGWTIFWQISGALLVAIIIAVASTVVAHHTTIAEHSVKITNLEQCFLRVEEQTRMTAQKVARIDERTETILKAIQKTDR